jgi:1,4-dihydroxy-2-naphthoate octaprenyltransferase
MGTTYVQTETAASLVPSAYAAIGGGALACAILVANNLRDVPTDREAGKRTLAVVLGDRRSRAFYTLLVLVALVFLVVLAAATTWWALLGLVFLSPAVAAVRTVRAGTTGRGLVVVLQRTGTAELVYAAGLFVGLLVG